MDVEGGLTVRRFGQLIERAVPRNAAERAPENLVRFLKQFARGRMMRRQVTPHPNALRSLPGKH